MAAVWAGHEGSLLFWVLTISCWSGVIAFQKHYSSAYQNPRFVVIDKRCWQSSLGLLYLHQTHLR